MAIRRRVTLVAAVAVAALAATLAACAEAEREPAEDPRPIVAAVVTDETFALLPDLDSATIERSTNLEAAGAAMASGDVVALIVDRDVYEAVGEEGRRMLRLLPGRSYLLIGIDITGNELDAGRLEDQQPAVAGFGLDVYSYFGYSRFAGREQGVSSGFGSLPRTPEGRFREMLDRIVRQQLDHIARDPSWHLPALPTRASSAALVYARPS